MLPKYFKTVIIGAFNSHLFLIVNLQDTNQPQQEEHWFAYKKLQLYLSCIELDTPETYEANVAKWYC